MTMWISFPSSNVHMDSSFFSSAKVSPSMMGGWPRMPTVKCYLKGFRLKIRLVHNEQTLRSNLTMISLDLRRAFRLMGTRNWWPQDGGDWEGRRKTYIDFFQCLCPGIVWSIPTIARVGLFLAFIFFVFIIIFFLQIIIRLIEIEWMNFTFSPPSPEGWGTSTSASFTTGVGLSAASFWA